MSSVANCPAIHRTALNGSDPPCSNPASTAVRTTARYSFNLRPFSPANSVYSIYRESATTFVRRSARRTFLCKQTVLGGSGARKKREERDALGNVRT